MTAQELFTSICERIPDALARHKVPGVVLGITFMAGSPTASSRSSRWCRNASSASRLRPIPWMERCSLATSWETFWASSWETKSPNHQKYRWTVPRCWNTVAAIRPLLATLSLVSGEQSQGTAATKGGFPTQETPPGPTPPPFRVGFVGPDSDSDGRSAHETRPRENFFVAQPARSCGCAGPVAFTYAST